MGILNLNNDILLLLADVLPNGDCARLARTCRRLRTSLSDELGHSADLNSSNRLKGLLEYVLFNDRRPSRVRWLLIQDSRFEGPGPFAKPLSELLHHTKNVRYLDIRIDLEMAVIVYPPLLDTINTLPRLTYFDTWRFGPKVLKGLLNMRSRLRTLKLRQAYPEAMDGIMPVTGGMEALKSLHLVDCSSEDDDIMIGSKGVWPTVRSLQVWRTDVCLEYLIEYFPNVHKFTMRGMGLQFIPFHRDPTKTDFWSKLDHFIPAWEDMQTFGFSVRMPPTRRLTFLNTFDEECAVHDLDLLCKILGETQPFVLSFPVIAGHLEHDVLPPRELKPKAAWKNLRCLTVTLLEESEIEAIYGWIVRTTTSCLSPSDCIHLIRNTCNIALAIFLSCHSVLASIAHTGYPCRISRPTSTH